MSSQYKARPGNLIPIIIPVASASVLTFIIGSLDVEIEPLTVFPETLVGATLNTSIFIFLIAFVAFLLYLLIKFGHRVKVRHIIKISFTVALFLIFEWYLTILTADNLRLDILDPRNILLSLVSTVIISAALFSGGSKIQLLAASTFASLTGTFLGVSVPLLTSFILLAGLSIYDFISVYKGPIGKIAEKADLEEFKGAAVQYDKLTIGMGDLVFYSMLVSTVMFNLGLIPYMAAVSGISIGAYGSLKILEKREMFPGLPLSLILGLALSITAAALL